MIQIFQIGVMLEVGKSFKFGQLFLGKGDMGR